MAVATKDASSGSEGNAATQQYGNWAQFCICFITMYLTGGAEREVELGIRFSKWTRILWSLLVKRCLPTACHHLPSEGSLLLKS